jgi:hypothetical protein
MHPYNERACMKSKLSVVYSHSSVQSSISNCRFGGTSCGWIGLRSVPITWADGYWSAKSLRQDHEHGSYSYGVHRALTLPIFLCQYRRPAPSVRILISRKRASDVSGSNTCGSSPIGERNRRRSKLREYT